MRKKTALIMSICLILTCTGCGIVSAPDAQNTFAETERTSEEQDTEAGTGEVQLEPVVLTIYDQWASVLYGDDSWMQQILLEKLNVKVQFCLEIEEDMPEPDIIIWASAGSQYQEAVDSGKLLDWNQDGLLENYGAYINTYLSEALEWNAAQNGGTVYGLPASWGTEGIETESYATAWEIRWDLYEELNCPTVATLEDYVSLLADMKALAPETDEGEEVYGIALWNGEQWGNYMPRMLSSYVSAYYGMRPVDYGFYDYEEARYHGCLEENGAYIQMLRIFNQMYRSGLLDPESRTQTYEEAMEKLLSGRVLSALVSYYGSDHYNTDENIQSNRMLLPLVPQEASVFVYPLPLSLRNTSWTITSGSEHPEEAMQLINWLCTPEGRLTAAYGPQELCWDWDERGEVYLTEFGKLCMEDSMQQMPEEYGGDSFDSGLIFTQGTLLSTYATNTDSSAKENYAWRTWSSMQEDAACEAEESWREYTGEVSAWDYMRKDVTLVHAPQIPSEDGTELEESEALSDIIINGSWDAIYAESDEAFEAVIVQMTQDAKAAGYEEMLAQYESELTE